MTTFMAWTPILGESDENTTAFRWCGTSSAVITVIQLSFCGHTILA